jgi:phage/plasmid-like protein (TIGR03299 family)
MPADIEVREDGTAAFLAVREPGWHGLGTVMPDDVSMEEALLIAQMRYTYELAPVFVDVDGTPVQVNGERQAVLRRNIDVPEDIKAFGGGLSTKFKPHSLLDLWGWAEDLLGHGASVETVGNLKDGAHSFATIKLPGSALEQTNDKVQMYLTVSTGHDGTKATTATVSPVRVVCSNTLAWANTIAKSKAKVGHRVSLDSTDADQTAQILGIMREQQDMVEATFSTLKAITLRPEDIGQIVSDLFPIPEDIQKKPYADLKTGEKRLFSLNTNARTHVQKLQETSPYRADGSDGWSLWQAVVEYSDYFSNVKGDDLAARRAERVMTGKADDLKAKALDLILA